MSWQDIRQRMLPPIGGVSPHDTSAFGATNRPPGSTNPHRGFDFNYDIGPNGQKGINLTHPAIRSPVTGIVENAGEGTVGRIAIRDANGFLHEILHTHTRHVAVGDPVVAGQLIGTMGNTGVKRANIEAGANHVHYQLKDRAGNIVNPTEFWDQQGPVDPNPAPPRYLGEYQQYLQNRAPMVPTDLATHRARQTRLRPDRSPQHRINRRLSIPGKPRLVSAGASRVNRHPSLIQAPRRCHSLSPIMCFLQIVRIPSTAVLETGLPFGAPRPTMYLLLIVKIPSTIVSETGPLRPRASPRAIRPYLRRRRNPAGRSGYPAANRCRYGLPRCRSASC